MLMVVSMIILFLFLLLLDKFYWTEAINQLKIIQNDLFFANIKMSYYQLNRDKLLEKAKNR